jgi:hypothetical protein
MLYNKAISLPEMCAIRGLALGHEPDEGVHNGLQYPVVGLFQCRQNLGPSTTLIRGAVSRPKQ